MGKWVVFFLCLLITAGLYLIEISKIHDPNDLTSTRLDHLDYDETSSAWAPFYRVRATLIDGQSARFSLPSEVKEKEGHEIEITGAAVFYGNGCTRENEFVTVSQFYLLPTLGLAQACVVQPDEQMRWTLQVHLQEPWILHCDEMINAMTTVQGLFRIDTSKPYEGIFFIDNAEATLVLSEDL